MHVGRQRRPTTVQRSGKPHRHAAAHKTNAPLDLLFAHGLKPPGGLAIGDILADIALAGISLANISLADIAFISWAESTTHTIPSLWVTPLRQRVRMVSSLRHSLGRHY